jgi:hypothetical protein
VWKSTSELGYLVNLHAIEQRVDGVGRPKFDSHTGQDRSQSCAFWEEKVPSSVKMFFGLAS